MKNCCSNCPFNEVADLKKSVVINIPKDAVYKYTMENGHINTSVFCRIDGRGSHISAYIFYKILHRNGGIAATVPDTELANFALDLEGKTIKITVE